MPKRKIRVYIVSDGVDKQAFLDIDEAQVFLQKLENKKILGRYRPEIETRVCRNRRQVDSIFEYYSRTYFDDMYYEQKGINDDMNPDEGDGWNNSVN